MPGDLDDLLYFVAYSPRTSNYLVMNNGRNNRVHLMVSVDRKGFVVSHILFEIPSTILLRRFKPHVWLTGCILAFGIAISAQGFVKNYSGLTVTRFYLGLAEAGIFPGSFYILSCWYKGDKALKRFAFYSSSLIVSNMFGRFLATTTSKMDGDRGYQV